jgi:hypothetical protein
LQYFVESRKVHAEREEQKAAIEGKAAENAPKV